MEVANSQVNAPHPAQDSIMLELVGMVTHWKARMDEKGVIKDKCLRENIENTISIVFLQQGAKFLHMPFIFKFLEANGYFPKYQKYIDGGDEIVPDDDFFNFNDDMLEAPQVQEIHLDSDDQLGDSPLSESELNITSYDHYPTLNLGSYMITMENPSVPKRQRLGNPCVYCRKSKRRCDEKMTCDECRKKDHRCIRIPSEREKKSRMRQELLKSKKSIPRKKRIQHPLPSPLYSHI